MKVYNALNIAKNGNILYRKDEKRAPIIIKGGRDCDFENVIIALSVEDENATDWEIFKKE